MFPEQTATPPQLPGQPTLRNSNLTGLRRQQLHDLAMAFCIEVPTDGTKEEILPVLREAELAGVFTQTPKRPEYLVKAGRNADQPPVDWMSHRAPDLDVNNFQHLRRIAKDAGINTFQMGEEEMREKLREMGKI